jgi:hypothetical protein
MAQIELEGLQEAVDYFTKIERFIDNTPMDINWNPFRLESRNRIVPKHKNTDGDDSGAPPTPMYETLDLFNYVTYTKDGIDVVWYMELLEAQYGIIMDPNKEETELFEELWEDKILHGL